MGFGLGLCCCDKRDQDCTATPTTAVRSLCVGFKFHWVSFSWIIDTPIKVQGDCPNYELNGNGFPESHSRGPYLCTFDDSLGAWNFIREDRGDGVTVKLQFEDTTAQDDSRMNVRLVSVELEEDGMKFIATWNDDLNYWDFDNGQDCKYMCKFRPSTTMGLSAYVFEEDDLPSQSFTVHGDGWSGPWGNSGASVAYCCDEFNASKTLETSDTGGCLGYSANSIDGRCINISLTWGENSNPSCKEFHPTSSDCESRLTSVAYGFSTGYIADLRFPGSTACLSSPTIGVTAGPIGGYYAAIATSGSLIGAPMLYGQTYMEELPDDYFTFTPYPIMPRNNAPLTGGDSTVDGECPGKGTIGVE